MCAASWVISASTFQIVGGVKVVAKNGKIVSATIGGEPLDDDRLYGVATLNFLLDGGDGYKVARNAEEVIMCNGSDSHWSCCNVSLWAF